MGEQGRVLIVSPGPDVAGCGISLKHAFDREGQGWQARHVRRKDNWLHYPVDATWDQLPELYEWADVIHVMQKPEAVESFPRKPTIVHHLGSRFRRDPLGVSAACQRIGAVELAGGHDLTLLPHLGWLPMTADLDGLSSIRAMRQLSTGKRSGHRGIRIAHAPTNRALKSTGLVVRAVKRLARHYPVIFDLIERVPWAACLARKAHADVFIDELTLGYGLNAIECWGMGIPVVSGLRDPRTRALMLEDFGEFPFVEASPASLYRTLERLVKDPELRAEHGERGRLHAERFHSERVIVQLAIGIYQRAMTLPAAA